ncbi:MAG: pyridoxamine 5'-phosphate oxidase family protein [Bacteroidia bacterium]
MLTDEIKKSIKNSVLCWLASSYIDGTPNVSPKEIFTYYGVSKIIIANIASPQSMRNIKSNPRACISFVDVFVQKGFKLTGKAGIVDKTHSEFESMQNRLEELTAGKFPFKQIIAFEIEKISPIVAPKYMFYPETTEESQIKSARDQYNQIHPA